LDKLSIDELKSIIETKKLRKPNNKRCKKQYVRIINDDIGRKRQLWWNDEY
jgi:hypothetical protein